MKAVYFFVLACLAHLSLSVKLNIREHVPGVEDVDENDFRQLLKNNEWTLLESYAPDCPHC